MINLGLGGGPGPHVVPGWSLFSLHPESSFHPQGFPDRRGILLVFPCQHGALSAQAVLAAIFAVGLLSCRSRGHILWGFWDSATAAPFVLRSLSHGGSLPLGWFWRLWERCFLLFPLWALLVLSGWHGHCWVREEPGCSMAFILALWAPLGQLPGKCHPPGLSETERWHRATPSHGWPSSGPGHTLPHCMVPSMRFLSRPLIPAPVLSWRLASEPGGGGGVGSAHTGPGWVAVAAVAGFVLTAPLSELCCGLAAVSREKARQGSGPLAAVPPSATAPLSALTNQRALSPGASQLDSLVGRGRAALPPGMICGWEKAPEGLVLRSRAALNQAVCLYGVPGGRLP
ncbi:uncharacterized protein LOC115938900 [Leptonychotes weddellii]|uniref:Uncharacterized protein LOC115938900 n=1 Tax=Leptonychotes weddellii TaxID=9713 RepID=A0A7F8QCD3_LEPWE|nr:uncharacterized protein LOC115938900 [Leptonychotes weddellii]